MKAITVKQPWANQILYCGKDIENRSRRFDLDYPLIVALHAGLSLAPVYTPKNFKNQVVMGAIIGLIDIIDCVEESESEFRDYEEPFGYVLANPRPLKTPIPIRGQLGFWNVPDEIEKQIRRQMKEKGA